MVSTQSLKTKEEREEALRKCQKWGERVQFLDAINSIDEFEQLVPTLLELADEDLVSFYRKNLIRWPSPTLEDWFKKEFPLVSSRLDTPQKIRIFLRGADFRGVSVSTMASVFEDIIKKHEVDGQRVVRYERYYGNTWCDALRVVYHTQVQAWTLTDLMLPGHTSCGGGTGGLFIDWRSERERMLTNSR